MSIERADKRAGFVCDKAQRQGALKSAVSVPGVQSVKDGMALR